MGKRDKILKKDSGTANLKTSFQAARIKIDIVSTQKIWNWLTDLPLGTYHRRNVY